MSDIFNEQKGWIPKSIEAKGTFQMCFLDIITATAPNSFISKTTFSNYILIVDAYPKIAKLYGMEIITTEELMDKLDMFQYRFGKIDKFGWWHLERI